jgi:CheY-like chemotaxis protein
MSQPIPEPAPKRPRPPAPTARVLLVDDSPEGRRSLARLLELSGFEVRSCPDLASALEALRSGPPPDVLLTDLFLPDGDGREAAEVAAALEPRPFIALITGWTLSDDDEGPSAGAIDRVFLKPVDIRSLVQSLREVAHDRGARG